MLKQSLSAALLFAAVPAAAQPDASPPAGQAAIQQAAEAFGRCVGTGIQGVAATVTPEAGAASVLAGCASQRQQLEQAAETMIAGSGMPEDQKAAARQRVRDRLAGAQSQIADGIRQLRAGTAATPAR